MNLVIVESPAKAKTIEKYLGKDFKVLASFGHVRDLPQKKLGVDVRHDFVPEYEIPAKSKKTVSEIRKAESGAKILYLATDLDREGEAISWHLLQALKIKENDPKVKRITFSEITKSALDKAIKNPRGIDMDLVDAQQARRVLDRLVGYKLSPLLWKKVKSGLSAGRVQSVQPLILSLLSRSDVHGPSRVCKRFHRNCRRQGNLDRRRLRHADEAPAQYRRRAAQVGEGAG